MVYRKWAFALISSFFVMSFHSNNIAAQEAGGTVAQAEKNIDKKRKERAKAKAQADKDAKAHFKSIQSKETQKRLKKQEKELKKRARAAKKAKRKRY